jgi:hypothetical protein
VCAVLVVALVAAVVVWFDERDRPGWFYRTVAAQMWTPRSLSVDWDGQVADRRYMADLAEQISDWDGVERVAWPTLQTRGGNFETLDPRLGTLTVDLTDDSSLRDSATAAFVLRTEARARGLDLAIILRIGKTTFAVAEECDLALTSLIAFTEEIVGDSRTARIDVWRQERSHIYEEYRMAVTVKAAKGVDALTYERHWRARAVDYGVDLTRVAVSVAPD